MATFFQWSELWVKFVTALMSNKILTTALIGIFASASTNVIQYLSNDDLAIKLNNTEQTAQYLENMIMEPPVKTKSAGKPVAKNITIYNCDDCIERIEKLEGFHK